MTKYSRVNFGYAYLASELLISSTSMTLQAGHNFPITSGSFVILIWDSVAYLNPANDPNKEFVVATYSGTANVYNIVRAQEGTSAFVHAISSKCGMFYSAGLSEADLYLLGSKEVDETAIGHGKFLYYSGSADKLRYAFLSGGGDMLQEVYDPTGVGHIPVIYVQATAPITDLYDGDFWINTSENNNVYTYTSSNWVNTSTSKATVFVQATVPTALSTADLWFNTSNSNKMYKSTNIGDNEIKAGEWELVDIGTVQVFMQDGIPTSVNIGDLWVDTNDSNKLYRAASVGADEIKAGEWVNTNVSGTNTFKQNNIPTSIAAGDLWLDTDDGDKLYRAACAGADAITAGEWESVSTATSTGWSSTSDATKIDGTYIYANTVTADKLFVSQLDAVAANTGTLTVDESISVGSSNILIDGVNQSIKVFGEDMLVTLDYNDDLDWTENGSTYAAVLTAGTYTPANLAAEVQTRMRAVGDADTTVTYSATTRKITIANSTLTTLTFKWSSGTHTATSCGKILGFSIAADDTGALTYTADYQTALRVELGLLS
jgi:hypothetical protein